MRQLLLSTLLICLVASACKGPVGPVDPVDSFDRKAMLRNYATALIRPAIGQMKAKTDSLYQRTAAFGAAPTEANLLRVQEAWKEAALTFQAANAYNFGPGEGTYATLVQNISTFPIDAAQTEAYIAAGDYSLANFRRDTRGLMGMDYLLFDISGEAAPVLARYQGEAGQKRSSYLLAVAADVQVHVNQVHKDWETYEADFITHDGTDAGSSASELYNHFVQSYESLKNDKVGLPAGLRAGQTGTEPTRVEAYYSGISVALIRAQVEATARIWSGKGINGIEGQGFADYLEEVEGGPALVADTKAQLAALTAALDALPEGRLSELVNSHPAEVALLFTELQKLTRFYKSDMSSLLGISITFASGDGD